MIWADKLALAWLALIVLTLAVLSSEPLKILIAIVTPSLWHGTWWPILRLAFIPWVLLRLIDWTTGGPKRRAQS